jgi:glycosyltransferase involved in cell wall biosynthesis
MPATGGSASVKLGFVASGSPADARAWSGTPHFALRELRRRGHDVTVIDTARLDRAIVALARTPGIGFAPSREPLTARLMAAIIAPKMRALAPEAIVSINADYKLLPFLDRTPCAYFSDAAVGPLFQYYDRYAALSARSRRLADDQERKVIASRCEIVLASHWAARTAAEHYGVPPARFYVAPLGPNLDPEPGPTAPPPADGPLRLLFVGYDWRRKGGALVLAAFKILRATLKDVELHIVGARPEAARGLDGVRLYGKLSKIDAENARTLNELYRTSSFFFMPSRQEAFGVVLSEACANGLPPVAADTGGLGTIIEDGVNGLLLPLSAGPEDFAAAIGRLWADRDAYLRMRAAARAAYEARLNWRAWGEVMEAALARATGAGGRIG